MILLALQVRYYSNQKICVIDRKIQNICALSDFYLRSYNTVLHPTSSLQPTSRGQKNIHCSLLEESNVLAVEDAQRLLERPQREKLFVLLAKLDQSI